MRGGPQGVVELLQALVRVPSVNPDGVTGTVVENTGEAAMVEWLGGFLRGLGAEVSEDEVLPGRANVIGRFASGGGGNKPVVVLAPHTDTVGVGGMVVEPFGGDVRGGRLWGRGACDTKGTMAAMLWALKELGADGIAGLGCEVWFVGLMGEEWGQDGSKDFAKRYAGEVDFALVGEPTGCGAVVRTKGALWPTLKTKGVAVHSSMPERGENAILKMVRALEVLDGDFREMLKREEWGDAMLGYSTLNIGVIAGGARSNIVPDGCEAKLDVRMTPAFYAAGGGEVLRAFLAERAPEVELTMPVPSPPLATDLGNPFVKVLGESGAAMGGAPWFSDASWLSAGGIASAIAGPGDIAQAHTVDEWIDLGELERGVGFYRGFLEKCGTGVE